MIILNAIAIAYCIVHPWEVDALFSRFSKKSQLLGSLKHLTRNQTPYFVFIIRVCVEKKNGEFDLKQ